MPYYRKRYKRKFKRKFRRKKRVSHKLTTHVHYDAAPYMFHRHQVIGLSAGTTVNDLQILMLPLLGENQDYNRCLTSSCFADIPGTASGTWTSSVFQQYDNSPISNTNYLGSGATTNVVPALQHKFWFEEQRRVQLLRNMDLNPIYITVYKFRVRKILPNIDTTSNIRGVLLDMLTDMRGYTDAAGANQSTGVFNVTNAANPYYATPSFITADAVDWSPYKSPQFCSACKILRQKSVVLAAGQVMKLESRLPNGYRRGIECIPDDYTPSTGTSGAAMPEDLGAGTVRTAIYSMNSIGKGKQVTGYLLKIKGSIGADAAGTTAGYLPPDVAFEDRLWMTVRPTSWSRPKWSTSLAVAAQTALLGPSAYTEQL